MAATGHLLQLSILVVCGWLQRRQAEMIEYLKAENRVLRQKLGGRRIPLTDAERRLLARKAYASGRQTLVQLNPIVTPDTLLRWHRELVASKWIIERRRPGRLRTRAEIEALTVRMATDNPGWEYTRLMGPMSNLGYQVERVTVRRILKDHGIERAPAQGGAHRGSYNASRHELDAADGKASDRCGG
jgi:hypothetical protein